jgi:hypothetical protein
VTTSRSEILASKLEKGRQKTLDFFRSLNPEDWQKPLYHEPLWQVRNLLVHFISAEKQLLVLAQDISEGDPGSPIDFDVNQFNADEQRRFEEKSLPDLLETLDQARDQTILWVRSLNDNQLDKVGRHPVLGEVSVETIIESIYGHQLMHMRDLLKQMRSVV